MASRAFSSASRVSDVPAFVLHTYPYKETSLIVEAFTETAGRIALIAKGAKRPTSAMRGYLQPFLPLRLAYTGKGEVKTLTQAEWVPGAPLLAANVLMLGYYVSELVLKLLPRDDPHPEMFQHYAQTLVALTTVPDANAALRKFELQLLAAIGYGVNLDRTTDTTAEIRSGETYGWLPERGVNARAASGGYRVSGDTLVGLREATALNTAQAIEAKKFMRHVLDVHLERRGLASRRLMQDVQALVETAR